MGHRRLLVVASVFVAGVSVACSSGEDAASGERSGARRAAAPAQAAVATYRDWPSYHGGRYRGGNAATMPPVSGLPRVLTTIALDGKVYASPIVVRGITVVATENNTVYAFTSAYRLLWRRHLGTPSPAAERPCGNIDPLGITGTPVYDGGLNSVYVAPEYSGNPPRHELVSTSPPARCAGTRASTSPASTSG